MTLELGGKVTIECEKTKCFTELEFKLKVQVNVCKLTLTSFDLFSSIITVALLVINRYI